MQVLLRILLYAGATVVGGALLAPPLWWAGQALRDLVPFLGEHPFHRYLNRAVLVTALVGLVPFLRSLDLRGLRALGVEPNPHWRRDVAVGLLLSISGLWALGIVLLLSGGMSLHEPFRWWAFPQAALTGVAVALIEELFFRAALFGALRRSFPWPTALAWLSGIFAVVHFIKPHHTAPDPDPVRWWSGFVLLPHAVGRMAQPNQVILGLLVLFVFGWILGYAVVHTRSLALAMGLHGGWVFALRSYAEITKRSLEPTVWIGKNLRTGLVPLALLGLSWLAVWFYLRGSVRVAPGPVGSVDEPT